MMYGDNVVHYYVGDYPPAHYYNPYYPQYPNYYPMTRLGWQCPGCNMCYSPDTTQCWNCGQGKNVKWTINTTNTELVLDKEEDGS